MYIILPVIQFSWLAGAVTSPTVISSTSHPPSPSFVGAIGSQFGAEVANFSSHPLNHARNYFGQDKNEAFLSSKMITSAEDDVHRQLADSEAEAEAAASAVAVAAISNDEAVGNHSDANTALGGGATVCSFASFSKSSGKLNCIYICVFEPMIFFVEEEQWG